MTEPERSVTGLVPREAIRQVELPPIDPAIVGRYLQLDDLTAAVSDAMDNFGLAGAIDALALRPSLPGQRVVGQAVTVRNAERTESPAKAAQGRKNLMGEFEAYHLSKPGNVIVIEGLTGVSNMGGQSATLAFQAKCAGAIIDGSHRDPGRSKELGFPIWSRGVTPITGKWRLRTIEINGSVRIAGVQVDAGDLVIADDAGVVFVPLRHVEEVLVEAERIGAGDGRQKQDIAAGIDLALLASRKYK